MSDLDHAVDTVVADCLAVRAGEDVLVIADEPLQDLGDALRGAAAEAQADAVLALMDARANHGTEPPPPVAAALAAATSSSRPTTHRCPTPTRASARPTPAPAARRCPASPPTCSRG